MINEVDLHGYTVGEAIRKIESILMELIIDNNVQNGAISAITGNGAIKCNLMSTIPEYWDVEVREKLGNSGILVIEWNNSI